MPARLSIPTFLNRGESSLSILPITAPLPEEVTRNTSNRTQSAGLPPPLIHHGRSNPQPVTAPAGPTALSTGRARAHTVSVSMRSARDPRRQSVSSADQDSAERGQREKTSSRSERRRISIDRMQDEGAGTSVSYDMPAEGELHDEVVGMLDVIDDHVSTVNHLQNMTNTLIFPQLPTLWSRRPEVNLPQTTKDDSQAVTTGTDAPSTASTRRRSISRPRSSTVSRLYPPSEPPSATWPKSAITPVTESIEPSPTETATQSLDHDIAEIEGDHELDAHVKDVLQMSSKWAKAKRIGGGVWTFVKTPMGAFTAIYGFLVAFWGAAIVLFLLGWIKTGSSNNKAIWVERSSQVENGLFTLTGVGLIPWRVRDTYRMVIIWRRKRLITQLRNQQGLPPIEDTNDLPDPKQIAVYVSVLSDEYVEQLRYQQEQFSKSQTWYRPHATETHRAFPINWALWNTILMDGNSAFQCILCGCMWGLNRHRRPAWTTGCLIPLSFLCGIGAAVLIWQGSVRTKKRDQVEDKLRAALGVPLDEEKIPVTPDGAVIPSNNRAPIPLSPTSAPLAAGKVTEKTSKPRRMTVTFGDVKDPVKQGMEGEGGRPRGVTIAAPSQTGGDGSRLIDGVAGEAGAEGVTEKGGGLGQLG